MRKYRADFVKKIRKDIWKHNPYEINIHKVDFLIEDILIYLDQDDNDKYMMNQAIFGIKYLFWGYIVKV